MAEGARPPSGPPVPILVLGSARSGTTWLGNLLAAHPDIAAPHHRVHWGSVESKMYSIAEWAGDLRDDRRFIQFVEVFASTDLFRLLEGDKERIYRERPTDLYQLMFDLFDQLAARRGARYWATKLDPPLLYRPRRLRAFLEALDRRYPDSRWVGIQRDARGVLRSYLQMEGERSIHRLSGTSKKLATMLESGRYVVHNRAIDELLRQRRGLKLTFAELREDEPAARERLSRHLGIDLAGVVSPYPANSSHRTRQAPARSLEQAVWLAEKVYLPAFEGAPALGVALLRLRDLTRQRRAPFYWRLLQLEQQPERFARELRETGQTALHDAIFARDE